MRFEQTIAAIRTKAGEVSGHLTALNRGQELVAQVVLSLPLAGSLRLDYGLARMGEISRSDGIACGGSCSHADGQSDDQRECPSHPSDARTSGNDSLGGDCRGDHHHHDRGHKASDEKDRHGRRAAQDAVDAESAALSPRRTYSRTAVSAPKKLPRFPSRALD
jgi:hypothetical protein